MKPQDIKEIIQKKIRFKPAKTIVQVLMAGNRILSSKKNQREMSISAEEATYCIFNDIRVTNGSTNPEKVAKTILENRKKKIKYYDPKDPKIFSSKGKPRTKGDVTRYAGDILFYMELANLLQKHHGYYSLKGNERVSLDVFSHDVSFFDGYDEFYDKKKYKTAELSAVESYWFEYVNNTMKPGLFKTDLRSIIGDIGEVDVIIENRIKTVVSSEDTTTKDIGNLGEAIICGHEKMRLKMNGYDKFVQRIQIVDSPSYHPGYDIDSFEGDGTENHRYIEVKTTISKQRIQLYGFHMSPNEWSVAGTINDHYCVYRLMLSEKDKTLFILRNPVRLYKTDLIEAEPRDGMEISFKSSDFEPTEVLIWKK